MDDLIVVEMNEKMFDECVELFMGTFSKEPYNDVYESRDQVVAFYRNSMQSNYFLGYVAMYDNRIVAQSIGMKKAWIEGMEYYIDEFCVDFALQGRGIGGALIRGIEANLPNKGLNAMMLNTNRGFTSEKFYRKNGFSGLDDLIILVK